MTNWAHPPDVLSLPRDHVDLWKAGLNPPEVSLRLLEQTLASDERTRAERFRFDRDRRRFIAARGQLRMILSRYVEVDPQALVFSYGLHEKPFLALPFRTGLKFNLSHSGELALVAVTLNREIGIDLEEIRHFDIAERLAERFFSRRENAALRALPEAERLAAFYCCWTLKEAYLKATGNGLARATDSFDVVFDRAEPARLLSVEGKSEEASFWSLLRLAPAPGYAGAVAVEGSGWTIARWEIRPDKDVAKVVGAR
jgi:4'-phosphopantetheinyl transferase